MAGKVVDIEISILPDENPDPSYLDQEGFEDRKKAFARGDFNYIGVQAVAEVDINGSIQHIKSMGVWGVESDSGDAYLRNEVGKEEFNDLKGTLKDMGIKSIPAFKSVRLKHYV